MAKVLHDEPNANFLQLKDHLAAKIDNLISMLTNIFYHLVGLAFFHTTPLLSWLTVIILSSLAQSIADTDCVCYFSSWMNYLKGDYHYIKYHD